MRASAAREGAARRVLRADKSIPDALGNPVPHTIFVRRSPTTRRGATMATIMRDATAVWTGAGKDGGGTLTTQSGTLKDTAYSFTTRFGDGKGTNPEEL